MSHPNGYSKEDVKKLLGSAWLDYDNLAESGNIMRRRIGNEMRANGTKKEYPTAESRSKLPNFDENGKYVYPEGSGFNYMQFLRDNPDSTEAGTYGSKVS